MVTRSTDRARTGTVVSVHEVGASALHIREVPVLMKPDRGTLAGSFALLLITLIFVYGLLCCVNGIAYLIGAGPEVTVHIERSSEQLKWVASPGGPGTAFRTYTNEGYYTDSSGERHAIELPDDYYIAPGRAVETHLPLLAGAIMFVPNHESSRGGEDIVVGLIFIGGAVFGGVKLHAAQVRHTR